MPIDGIKDKTFQLQENSRYLRQILNGERAPVIA
jgi:hypothetical protein